MDRVTVAAPVGPTLKRRLAAGETIAICNPDYPTPRLVEFIGTLGFDAIFIDCEHSSTDFGLVDELARAARAVGMASVVRPWSGDPSLINRYLSCGVDGVQVPHVHSVDQARAILAGMAEWEGDHRQKLLVAMIESQHAIVQLPELLKIGEIDVFYIGAFDLALSMGLKGNPKHPQVKAVVDEAIRQIAGAGKVAGLNLQDEIEALAEYRQKSLRWINVHLKAFVQTGAKPFLSHLRKA
jgi:4-hydroxy-2-oxoheptanedioate aldolase